MRFNHEYMEIKTTRGIKLAEYMYLYTNEVAYTKLHTHPTEHVPLNETIFYANLPPKEQSLGLSKS